MLRASRVPRRGLDRDNTLPYICSHSSADRGQRTAQVTDSIAAIRVAQSGSKCQPNTFTSELAHLMKHRCRDERVCALFVSEGSTRSTAKSD
jgi:hypothetical protein